MIALSQPAEEPITEYDRKIEALIQLQENSLFKMKIFKLERHKKDMQEYMKGRDFLIQELYDEIWIQQSMNKEKDEEIKLRDELLADQAVMLDAANMKINKKNKTIIILLGVNIALLGGILLLTR